MRRSIIADQRLAIAVTILRQFTIGESFVAPSTMKSLTEQMKYETASLGFTLQSIGLISWVPQRTPAIPTTSRIETMHHRCREHIQGYARRLYAEGNPNAGASRRPSAYGSFFCIK